MSLDLIKVVAQVEGMVSKFKAEAEQKRERLLKAIETLSSPPIDLDSLKRKIQLSKTTWLVAGLTDGLAQHYQTPAVLTEFDVISTDGSHIDVDRHRLTRCFLVNIGSVMLHYGTSPTATLDSSPHLYSEDEELVITTAGAKNQEQLIEGTLLGVKRSVDECQALTHLATQLENDSPTLALLDGSLILWGLSGQAYPQFVTETLLQNGFLKYLDGLRKLNNGRRLALASYISFPRSSDVVNALRVAICPHQPPDCDRYCPPNQKRECDSVGGVQDRELFSSLLGSGERSALFLNQSSIVKQYYGPHWVHFFYLNVGDEVARIEIPKWVADDESLVELVHVLVLDQCRRGQGYPVALTEAHEKAVLSGADREEFWQLVELTLQGKRLPNMTSAKSLSKRIRWV